MCAARRLASIAKLPVRPFCGMLRGVFGTAHLYGFPNLNGYFRRTHGHFVVKHYGETRAGDERFTVTGRKSLLLIVSNKSRHFLLRTLCRMLRGR